MDNTIIEKIKKELKPKRDTLNKELGRLNSRIEYNKKRLEKIMNEKNIDENATKLYSKIKREIKRLEWKVQTEALTIKQDENIRKKIMELENKIKDRAFL